MSEDKLPSCPVCGAKAFLSRDIADGFFFGWSVGCPCACIGDRKHKINDPDEFKKARLVMSYFNTRDQAIKAWKKRCKE